MDVKSWYCAGNCDAARGDIDSVDTFRLVPLGLSGCGVAGLPAANPVPAAGVRINGNHPLLQALLPRTSGKSTRLSACCNVCAFTPSANSLPLSPLPDWRAIVRANNRVVADVDALDHLYLALSRRWWALCGGGGDNQDFLGFLDFTSPLRWAALCY